MFCLESWMLGARAFRSRLRELRRTSWMRSWTQSSPILVAFGGGYELQRALPVVQALLTQLCNKINAVVGQSARVSALLDITLHERDGLQLTFRVDGKKCFYRHLSENTKLLFAFHLYAEASKIDRAVLLFDEPNAGFHPSAQGFVLGFLRTLALKNQVVFSTHSQHMIDLDHLGDIRIMSTDDRGGLLIRKHFYRGSPERGEHLALQPIIDAIGLSFARSLTLGNKMVVTEGITDMMYLR